MGRTPPVPTATALSALSSAPARPATPAMPATPGCATLRRVTAGTLKSVSGGTLTVMTPGGTSVTVRAGTNTKVTQVVKATLSDVTVGASVAVHGAANGAAAIAADQVAVLPMPTPPRRRATGPRTGGAGFALGTVQSVASSGFTVSSGGSTITITTSSSTAFSKAVQGTVNDLVVGRPIAVSGTPNGDGSITATSIEQAAGDTGPGGFPGFAPGFGLGPGFGPGFGVSPGPGFGVSPGPGFGVGPGPGFGHRAEAPGGTTTTTIPHSG